MDVRGDLPPDYGSRAHRREPIGHTKPGGVRATCTVCKLVYILRDGKMPAHLKQTPDGADDYCEGSDA